MRTYRTNVKPEKITNSRMQQLSSERNVAQHWSILSRAATGVSVVVVAWFSVRGNHA